MAWYDWLPGMNTVSLASGISGHGWSGSKSLGDVYEWGQQKANATPQMGENPYMGQWNDLIGQLQKQSNGEGPSLAGNAYNQAHAQTMNDAMSMGRGGSAGAARGAQRMMGQANQGLAAGYSNARLQEQLAARQQLAGALGGAGNAWFQPQELNLRAQLGMMNSPTNMQNLTGLLQQLGSAGASAYSMGQGGGGKIG